MSDQIIVILVSFINMMSIIHKALLILLSANVIMWE